MQARDEEEHVEGLTVRRCVAVERHGIGRDTRTEVAHGVLDARELVGGVLRERRLRVGDCGRRGVEDDVDRSERRGEEVVWVVRVARILGLVLDVVQPIGTAYRERAAVGDALERTWSRAVLVDPVARLGLRVGEDEVVIAKSELVGATR